MRALKCEKCNTPIVVMPDINCRLMHVDRIEETNTYIKIICVIELYCPRCGNTNILNVSHVFSNDYAKLPDRHLAYFSLAACGDLEI